MRAICLTQFGNPDVLKVIERDDPTPKRGQVRIRVHAAGLNFAELMARQGLYPDAPKPPCVLGYEVSGEIDALGDDASGFKIGDRVIALTPFGGHADCVCVASDQAVPMPDNMRCEEAASIPVNYLTAYHMLFHVANLRPNQRVLIHMAAGGVGIAALQLCKTVSGVISIGTASSAKHDAIREQGCDHPIDYRSCDYVSEVKRITHNEGVDIILDALGGNDWRKGYHLLKPAGKLIAFGFANMAVGEKRKITHVLKEFFSVPRFSPVTLMNDNRSVGGVHLGHLWKEKALLKESLLALINLYGLGKIKPQVDSVFAFADAPAAHRRMQDRQNVGKIILVP